MFHPLALNPYTQVPAQYLILYHDRFLSDIFQFIIQYYII